MQQIILNTCPDNDTAKIIADTIIGDKLAACVNIIGGISSVYAWQGKVERSSEHLLIIKCPALQFDAVSRTIKRLHPYEIPEIIAVPIANGSPEYLNWIDKCCAK